MTGNPCVICGATATTWRLFMPHASCSARIGWLCADHLAVCREAFHAACIAHPANADVAAYEKRNREQIERERGQAEALSNKRRAAIARRWANRTPGKAANTPLFVSKTPQIQAKAEFSTCDPYDPAKAQIALEVQP